MILEIWKQIQGYEGLYEVSNLGNVRSMNYRGNGTIKNLSQGKGGRGYNIVVLYKNKTKKTYSVHKLVAETFVDNPNNLPVVNHIDCNKTNNRADNLEWCTQKQNVNDAWEKGLNEHIREISRQNISPTNMERKRKVRCITTNQIFDSIFEAKIITGAKHISDCCKNKRKTSGKSSTGEKLEWEYV